MFRIALFCATLIVGVLGTSTAHSGEMTGHEVLVLLDDMTKLAKDHQFVYEVVSMDPGKKEPRHMKFSVQMKEQKSLTQFMAPGDIKGTRVLVLGRTQMYIYLPQYNKVRRIGSHVTEQGFMGTTYSHADMSTLLYGDLYTGKMLEEDDDFWVVEANANEGVEVFDKKIVFKVDKKVKAPVEVKYYNSKGEVGRTNTRSDYTCQQDICTAKVMRMTDHTRNDAWTEIIQKEWAVNQGVDEGLFTVRELQRGH